VHDKSSSLDYNPDRFPREFTENSPADFLRSRTDVIVERLAQRLDDTHNPLRTDPEVWPHVADWVSSVVLDCSWSLFHGRPSNRVTRMSETYWAEAENQPWAWKPQHTGEAGRFLFEEILRALEPVGPHERIPAALVTVNNAISLRMEAAQIRANAEFLSSEQKANQEFRRYLARELHDRIGSSVSLASRQLELYELLSAQPPAGDAGGRLHALKNALFEVNQHLRQLISDQRRSERDGSLLTALRAYVTALDLTEPEVRFEICGDESWVPPHYLDELFIVLRECVRNSLRHARAGAVHVAVRFEHTEVRAIASDDGVGFDADALGSGGSGLSTGLTSLHERIEAIGGRVRLLSAPGEGTRTMILVPITTPTVGAESRR
jgi:signal transduction histidine kinase